MKRNSTITYLMLFFYFSSTLSLPIQYFLGVGLYKYAASFLLAYSAFAFISANKKINLTAINRTNLGLLIYILFLFYGFISGLLNNGIIDAILGLVEYSFYALPLMLLLSAGLIEYKNLIFITKINSYMAVLIGMIGVYQYFYDFLLFGIYNDTEFEELASWSVKRIPSIMISIQIYSAYMCLSAVGIWLVKPFEAKHNIIFIVLILSLGSLSGSQTIIFVALVMIIFGFASINWSEFIYASTLILIITVAAYYSSVDFMDIDPFLRIISVIDFDTALKFFGQINSSRFDIWMESILNTPILAGNGFGSASLLAHGSERFNTESYILQVYYETGLIGLILWFFSFGLNTMIKKPKEHLSKGIIALTIYIFFGFVVHVFFSINLFYTWLLFFGYFSTKNSGVILKEGRIFS